MDELRFGTDGWRDRIGERFTTANVRRAAQATADHLRAHGGRRVAVAHDPRFGGAMFARAAAETLAANGLEVLLADGPLPTPVLSFAVRHLGLDAGVMLTASHNPPAWNGFKLKGPYGGTATDAAYRDVAGRAARIGRDDVAAGDPHASFAPLEVRAAYYHRLAELLDLEALRGVSGTVVHDAMGGAAAGWLAGFARHARLTLRLEGVRDTPDPLFHGAPPEPIPRHMGPLLDRMAHGDAALGIATDGDGDRLAAALPGGRPLNPHEVFALLLDARERAGGRGRVVKTVTVARLIERLASARGLPVTETPVGFKWLVEELRRGGALIAGEESGGIGIPEHLPERDAILNGWLLVEAWATAPERSAAAAAAAEGDGGGPLAARLAALEREADWRHHYDRRDLDLGAAAAQRRAVASLDEDPGRFAGRDVTSVERSDGVKLNLAGKAWLLVRASGTEPVLRLYAEAQSAEEVEGLLDAAERLVREAAG
jgi:phosphomannomutase